MCLVAIVRRKLKMSKSKFLKRKHTCRNQKIFNAVSENYLMLARILINERFEINSKNDLGETLLVTLCRTSCCENEEKLCFVRYLLNRGACLNAVDKLGRTARYYAQLNGLYKISSELSNASRRGHL